jgi:hypothetical protein
MIKNKALIFWCLLVVGMVSNLNFIYEDHAKLAKLVGALTAAMFWILISDYLFIDVPRKEKAEKARFEELLSKSLEETDPAIRTVKLQELVVLAPASEKDNVRRLLVRS